MEVYDYCIRSYGLYVLDNEAIRWSGVSDLSQSLKVTIAEGYKQCACIKHWLVRTSCQVLNIECSSVLELHLSSKEELSFA